MAIRSSSRPNKICIFKLGKIRGIYWSHLQWLPLKATFIDVNLDIVNTLHFLFVLCLVFYCFTCYSRCYFDAFNGYISDDFVGIVD